MSINRRNFLKTSVIGSVLAILRGKNYIWAKDNLLKAAADSIDIEQAFTFCVVADPHCEEGINEAYGDCGDGVDKFFACIKKMEELEGDEKPDFMLIVGDIHLWALEEHLDKIKIPMHVIAGNHASVHRRKEMRELFAGDFKKEGKEADYYSFVHKGVRFIGVCDAGRGGEHIGQFCSEDINPRGQCEWLEQELAAKEVHKIIFAHIPPEPEGRDLNMYLSRNDSRYFNKLIKQTEPTAMFFGHHHVATCQQKIGKTQSFTVRSCCWNAGGAKLGFIVVKISSAGISTREIFTS